MTEILGSETQESVRQGRQQAGFWKPFFVLSALGLVGVASLFPTLGPVAEAVSERPEVPDLPIPLLKILLLGNPILFLLVGVAVGTKLAPRLGLHSHVAQKAREGGKILAGLRPEIPAAVAWGAVAAVLILVLDALMRPLLGDPAEILSGFEGAETRSLAITLAGMLYGGITEELMTRWGLVSLLAWIPWRLAQGGQGRPRPWVLWSAILLGAVAFGAGHLSALDPEVILTPPVVFRTIALNALGGVIFGWLFWRKSLEAAMIAHASAHVVFSLTFWLKIIIGWA